MNKPQKRTDQKARRTFLKTTFLGSTAVFAAMCGRAAARPLSKASQNLDKKGYQLTDHVKKYYKTASF